MSTCIFYRFLFVSPGKYRKREKNRVWPSSIVASPPILAQSSEYESTNEDVFCPANEQCKKRRNWSPTLVVARGFRRILVSVWFLTSPVPDSPHSLLESKIKTEEHTHTPLQRTFEKTRILRCDKDEKSLFHFTNRFDVSVRVWRIHELCRTTALYDGTTYSIHAKIVPDVVCIARSHWCI